MRNLKVSGSNKVCATLSATQKLAFFASVSLLCSAVSVQASQEWTYTSTAGRIASVDGPLAGTSDTTNLAYYSASTSGNYNKGNLYTVTNAKSHITTFSGYSIHGQPTKKVDANNVETEYEWYARGWLKKLTVRKVGETDTSKHAVTVFTRDNVGQLTLLTRPDGSFASFEYDNAHRLHAIMNYHNDRIEYVRDAAGNVTGETIRKNAIANTDGSGTKVQGLTRGFDELSRLLWVKNDAGTTVASYTYDNNGNIDTMTRSGLVTDYDFDALNHLSTVKDPLHTTNDPHKTQYMHDALDHITKVTDANNLETVYTVNGLDEITALVSPDSGTTTFTSYDAAGNVLTKVHGGITTTYTYDELNRVTTINYPGTAKDVVYTYDNASGDSCNTGHGDVVGRLCRVTVGGANKIDYTYDFLGRVLEEKRQPSAVAPVFVTSYQYDMAGNLTKVTYPDNQVVNYPRVSGKMISVTDANDAFYASDITHQAFGGIRGFNYTDNALRTTRTLDTDGRLDNVMVSNGGDITVGKQYNYDSFNNMNVIYDENDNWRNVYGYDNLQRLINEQSFTGAFRYDYTYDKVGNRETRVRSDADTATLNWVLRFTDHYAYQNQTITDTPATPVTGTKDSNRLKAVVRVKPEATHVSEVRKFTTDNRGSRTVDHRKKCNASGKTTYNKSMGLVHGDTNRLDSVTVDTITPLDVDCIATGGE